MKEINIGKGKVLLVANSPTPLQKGLRLAIKSFGWDLHIFCLSDYVNNKFDKMQIKYAGGPLIKLMNKALVKECVALKPKVVVFWKGISILPKTIQCIKNYVNVVVSFNFDDPFGQWNIRYAKKYNINGNAIFNKIMHYEKVFSFYRQTARFIQNIPYYDIHFISKAANIKRYQKAGAKEVKILELFFTPEFHYPIEPSPKDIEKYKSDVVFIGHYEPDHRSECLEALLDAGINVKLFGTGWSHYLTNKLKRAFGSSIKPLYGDEYVRALCSSKMALCFMSKLNKDDFTTRCFEIPACGCLLLSERTDKVISLYEEDKEAVCFSSKAELVKKVQMLLEQPEKCKAIATAGYKRCLSSKYDVYSRMRVWNDAICNKLNINKKK